MDPLPLDGARLPARLACDALDRADSMVVITDTDGTIVYVNPAFEATTGYRADEVIGGNPRTLKSGVHDDDFYRELWDTVLAGEPWHGEIVNRRKDGSLYTDEMAIAPLADDTGRLTHFVAIKRDVSRRVESLTASSPVGIAHVGHDGVVRFANRRAEELVGSSGTGLVGSAWHRLFRAADLAALERLGRAADGSPSEPVRLGSRWLRVRAAPLVAEDGSTLGTTVTLEDATAEVDATLEVEARERFARDVIDSLPDPTVVLDLRGRIELANDAWVTMAAVTGRPAPLDGVDADGDYLGTLRRHAAAGDADAATLAARLGEVALGVEDRVLVELAHDTDGGTRWYAVRGARLRGGSGLVVSHVDITWRKRAEEHLEFQVAHDPLTGLANRSMAIDHLERALDRARRRESLVAVLFADLDGFKDVNDRLGHAAGDAVLVEVARRLAAAVRRGDVVARFGGDEFVVICEDAGERGSIDELVVRLRAAVAAPIAIGEAEARVGVSVGVVVSDGQGSADELLAASDREMYRAKRSSRGRGDPT